MALFLRPRVTICPLFPGPILFGYPIAYPIWNYDKWSLCSDLNNSVTEHMKAICLINKHGDKQEIFPCYFGQHTVDVTLPLKSKFKALIFFFYNSKWIVCPHGLQWCTGWGASTDHNTLHYIPTLQHDLSLDHPNW